MILRNNHSIYKFIVLILLTGLTCNLFSQNITFQSDNKKLENAFQWAVKKSLSWQMTGKTVSANSSENGPELGFKQAIKCMPSYWAGYANRTAFYARDFSHQSAAAHLIGMDEENFLMYEAFAKHCTEDKKWYSWWALNFDGSVYTLDAPNPPGEEPYPGYPADFKNPKGERFVREVPAVFDLVYRAYKCYLWTGDKRYLTNSLLKTMYEKAMTDFISLHDSDMNGVPEGVSDIWNGSATYNEREIHPKEAGDAIAIQYQAQLAYAGLLKASGEATKATQELKKAEKLYRYFNDDWSKIPSDSLYACAILKDGTKYGKFNKESTFLMPLYLITAPGERTNRLLDHIYKQVGGGKGTANEGPGAMNNIEAYTYMPELYFQYNRVAEAYQYMNYIISQLEEAHEVASQGNNGNFPETPFMLVSHMVEGMMGVTPNAPEKSLSTIPRLPADTQYASISNLTVGSGKFELTHRNNTFSTLRCLDSNAQFTWEASFYGKYSFLKVNGKKLSAQHKTLNGEEISFVKVKLENGKTVQVEVIK